MPRPLFSSSVAGSLPKPEWLAETGKLWPQWKSSGAALASAKADATLLWIKAQEDAGLDVIGDGEQEEDPGPRRRRCAGAQTSWVGRALVARPAPPPPPPP